MLFMKPQATGFALPLVAGVLGLAALSQLETLQQFLLLGLGLLLGATLNYFGFGFASAWRRFLKRESSEGVRAQVVMLLLASGLFFALVQWHPSGEYNGILRPIGWSIVVGAFLFGVGMQLAQNCVSGALRATGDLNGFSAITVMSLIVGATFAAYHMSFWEGLPRIAPISFFHELGVWGWVIQALILIRLYAWFANREQKWQGQVKPIWPHKVSTTWHPLLLAGILLAVLNFLVFWLSGRPWVVSNVFPVWGIHLSDWFNLGLEWDFWDYGVTHMERLEAPIWQDTTHLTTLGVILGALIVAVGPGKSKLAPPSAKPPVAWSLRFKTVGFSVIGGLIMGYGALISYGCNVGAFFSGIGSGSLHGWLWLLFAVIGNAVGLGLREYLVQWGESGGSSNKSEHKPEHHGHAAVRSETAS